MPARRRFAPRDAAICHAAAMMLFRLQDPRIAAYSASAVPRGAGRKKRGRRAVVSAPDIILRHACLHGITRDE